MARPTLKTYRFWQISVIILCLGKLGLTNSTMTDPCQISWSIITNPIKMNEDVHLQCKTTDANLCPGIPRWEGGPEHKPLSFGYHVFLINKYEIESSPGKYVLTIKQISKDDLTSRYVCHVRFKKYGAVLMDKKPIYSLMAEKPKLMKKAKFFANISAVPFNNKNVLYSWSRYPFNKIYEVENLTNTDKYLQEEEVDGLSLTIINVTVEDVNKIYKLNYSGIEFIAFFRKENTTMEAANNNDSMTHNRSIPLIIVSVIVIFIVIGIGIMVYVFKRIRNAKYICVEQVKYSRTCEK